MYGISHYAGRVLQSNGQSTTWVFPGLEEEPTEREQSYYKKLCEFYRTIDPVKFVGAMDTHYSEGEKIHYKQFYKKLKQQFRCN